MTKKQSALSKLKERLDPIKKDQVRAKMIISAKIDDLKRQKGWSNKELLEILGKNHLSVLTKWLSGTHNFTVDTLVEIENKLQIKLLDLSPYDNNGKNQTKYSITMSIMSRINELSKGYEDQNLVKVINKELSYISTENQISYG